ncbi:MAG TPA: radical SAM protein [Candidatus Brocadiia bacterium]|nr:radical SAM protein [Candidatus Brocadiia bacterium]
MSYRLMKWLNSRQNDYEYRTRRVVLKSFPTIVYVDPSNVCNLRCALCPSGQGKIPAPHGRMDMGLFKDVVSVLAPRARQLHVYNWGEPLLHPHIIEMLRFARRFGPRIYLSTNLNILKPGMAEELVNSGLDVLNASIDGISQETYGKYRQGGDLSKVIANIRSLAEAKRKSQKSRLTIRWQYLVNRYNESEIPEARKMARELGVSFSTKKIRVGLDSFADEGIEETAQKQSEWLPENSKLNRYKREEKRLVCRHVWDRTIVNFNGGISPCCQIFEPKHFFSETFDGDFMKIWNGPAYTAARRMFATGKIASESERLVCRKCMELGNIL